MIVVLRADSTGPVQPGQVRAEQLLNPAELADKWKTETAASRKRAMRAGYLDTADDLGMRLRFDTDAPRVQAFLQSTSASKIVTIAESRFDEVRALLERSIAEGVTTQELGIRLREHFEGGSRFWSMRIARTETNGLYAQASVWAMADGGTEKKEWLSSRDSFVRDTHVEADGQVVGIDEDFQVGAGSGPAPGLINLAEESINCRCAVLPVLETTETARAEDDDARRAARGARWAKHDERLLAAEGQMARTWAGLFEDMADEAMANYERVI